MENHPDSIDEKSEELWREEYLKRQEVDQKEGRLEILNAEDRRRNPRLQLEQGKNIWVHSGRVSVPIINISIGGLAFYSEKEHMFGDRVFLNVANSLSIEGEVLSCEMERVDSIFMEYLYKVRVRYSPGTNGYKTYVIARDIYTYNLERKLESPRAN